MTQFINEQFHKAGLKWHDRFKNKTFVYFNEGKQIVVLHSHWVMRKKSFAFDIQQVASIDAWNWDAFLHSIMSLSFNSAEGFLGRVYEDAFNLSPFAWFGG